MDQCRLNFNSDDDDESATIITAAEAAEETKESAQEQTASKVSTAEVLDTNRFALFEEYLSFLDKKPDGTCPLLNPVLLGYWCNLFRSLVQTHPQEVFIYVYEH